MPAAPESRETIQGRRLMIGLLVVFFGLTFLANGLAVYLATQAPPAIEATYMTEAR